MCVIVYNVTVNVIYKPILASRPRSRRLCLGVRLYVTLIVRHIEAYAWPQFEITLPNQIRLILLIFFYHIKGNVFVSVTYTPSLLAEMPSYMSVSIR